MHKFVRSLITGWRKLELPVADECIVIAVSGGADSMSLLVGVADLLGRKKLSLRIVVAHFNHRLRGTDSDADQTFVEKAAGRLGFDCVTGRGRISQKGNLEQNARDARYKFLTEVAVDHKAGVILTGHTMNDQAETFLLNLIRGSGPDGLAGMSALRPIDSGIRIARPLLGWATRNDTEQFCLDNLIRFRSDRMNDDESFARVRIRKSVIPLLAELNPRIVETLARTSDLLRGIQSEPDVAAGPLELKRLRPMPTAELYRQLRTWLRSYRGDLRSISLKHIEAIERLINSPKSGKTVEIPGGGRVVRRAGMLSFTNIKVEK